VFERHDRMGGLLMYGIPNMKLDKSIVERRVRLMADEGVRFVVNTEVGSAVAGKKIKSDFDAVVLCTGATVPRDLPAQGRQLPGIHFAMDFLHQNTKSLLDSKLKDGNYISAKDKHVIVIGGGDTGTDCVATSMRHGCKSLVQFEILEKPPLTRGHDNPWPQWPKIYKMDYGQEEAAAHFGNDPRDYLMMTKEFMTNVGGRLQAVKTTKINWQKDGQGRMVPVDVPGSEKTWPADLVLLAMGFLGPEQTISQELSIETDARSNFRADENRYKTSQRGVFAAGDCRRGQSLVVWAIREGRGAARECDRFLMGSTNLP